MNLSFIHTLLKVHGLYFFENIQFLNLTQNFCRCFRRDLAAVRSVDFISVVLGRIVGSRHHDSRRAVQIPHRKRQARSGHQLRINIHLNIVGREYSGRHLREQIRFDAGIIAYRDLPRAAFIMFFHIIRQSLGRFCHRMHIHPVGSRADHAAQPAGSKSQIPIKRVFNPCSVSFYFLKFFHHIRIRLGILPPDPVLLHDSALFHLSPPNNLPSASAPCRVFLAARNPPAGTGSPL